MAVLSMSTWKKLTLIPVGIGIGLVLGWQALRSWEDGRRPQSITAHDHDALRAMLDDSAGRRGLYLFDESLGYRFKSNWSGTRHQTEREPHLTNSLGLLGRAEVDADPNVSKILFLGDSVTYGDGVAFEAVFVSRMQHLAGMEYQLLNAACPGWSLTQELEFFASRLEDKADWSAVVLMICLNDFCEFNWCRTGDSYEWVLTEGYSAWDAFRAQRRRQSFRSDAALQRMDRHDDATLMAWEPGRIQQRLGDALAGWRSIPDRPQLVVVVLPTRYQVASVGGDADDIVSFPQQEIAGVCESHDIPCLDLLALWRETEALDAAAHYLEADALHFTEAGHAAIAELLWPELARALTEPGE